MRTKNVLFFISILATIFLTTSVSHAQTTYESDRGFFTPVVESLYLQGGILEDTQLIGPAVGYRFNDRYDLSLHAEFLNSETGGLTGDRRIQLSILNIGITAGQTYHWDNNLLLRNELSAYHSFNLNLQNYNELSAYRSFNLNLQNYQGFTTPSLTSILGVSSIYKSLSVSENITFMPNIGAVAGVGDYQPPVSSGNLRQGFDGFVAGPQLGLDTKFNISESFSITTKPQYRLRYNFTHEQSTGTLTFNILFNF